MDKGEAMNVRDEINAYAKEDDKPVLLWLFGRYSWASRWYFVADMKPVRYGLLSYETYRVWHPTPEGRILYANRDALEKSCV